jgi:hypothetical protein
VHTMNVRDSLVMVMKGYGSDPRRNQ